jgi:hypothetical protein
MTCMFSRVANREETTEHGRSWTIFLAAVVLGVAGAHVFSFRLLSLYTSFSADVLCNPGTRRATRKNPENA